MLKAVIFDFDGTIANSEPIHFELFAKVLGEEKIFISKEENDEFYLHLNDKDSFELALRKHGKICSHETISNLVQRKSAYYNQAIVRRDLLFPGASEFIRIAARSYPVAIASGALMGEIQFILSRSDLLDLFPVIVAAEQTEQGKPYPESYLKALLELNAHWKINPEILPPEVLVIEDSVGGVKGARRAEMACLAITNSYSRQLLQDADFIVESFSEIDLGALHLPVQR